MRNAFRSAALKLYKRFKPKKIMEIGSNDGVFLKNFPRKKVVGVEPCKNLAKLTKNKYKTFPNFWNKKLAEKIFLKSKKADVIFSANTISHIPNLKETFDAIGIFLTLADKEWEQTKNVEKTELEKSKHSEKALFFSQAAANYSTVYETVCR